MPPETRPRWWDDYWWAAIVIPLAAVVSVVLVVGSLGGGTDDARQPAVAAAVTSPAPDSTAPDGPSGSGSPAADAARAVADAAACRTNTTGKRVVVSISAQRMRMCGGPTLITASEVTTGIDTRTDRTPTGTWQIVARETDRYLVGADYRVFVHYWLPFFGDFGFHDSPWQTFPYGSQQYRTNGSRGCVHVPAATMAELYRWATVGTTVTVTA